MAKIKVHLPQLFPYQQEVKDHPARFKVLAIGRRAGKSFFAKVDALDRAINYGQKVWLVYPSYPTSSVHWRELNDMIADAPFIKERLVSERMIRFSSGGMIEIKSADKYHNLRGSGLDHVVMDEAAFVKKEVFTSVILPALADKQGTALLISTPFGRNWFWEMYNLGQNPDYEDWISWQYPSTISPLITTKERDIQKKVMPRREFLREWMASFEGTGGGAFVNFEETMILSPFEDEFPIGASDVGIDWGRKDDFTVVSSFNHVTREQNYLDRFTDIGFEKQAQKVCAALNIIKPRYVFVEYNHIGMVMFELLKKNVQQSVLPSNPQIRLRAVEMTNPTKQVLVDHYATLIEHGYVKHFNDTHEFGIAQGQELSAYTVSHSAGGLSLSYGNDKGTAGHDDIVVANMLAVQKIKLPIAVVGVNSGFASVPNPFYGG